MNNENRFDLNAWALEQLSTDILLYQFLILVNGHNKWILSHT